MASESAIRTIAAFEANIILVKSLMVFDKTVLDFAITVLQKHEAKLSKAKIDNPVFSVAIPLQELKNIRENESLRKQYQAIIDQGLVLLVSYFASAVSDLFCELITDIAVTKRPRKLLGERVEVAVEDLLFEESGDSVDIGRLIIQRKDVSFQDMKSIARLFNDFLDYDPLKDRHVNNIIVAQACRHAIVHSGGKADQKLLNQIRDSVPRDLKAAITLKDSLYFSLDEIDVAAASMQRYLVGLLEGVGQKWGMVPEATESISIPE
jgi:hypothetical protein